jgi:hypothetical protein
MPVLESSRGQSPVTPLRRQRWSALTAGDRCERLEPGPQLTCKKQQTQP